MGETVATLLSLVSLTRETLDSALLLKVLLGEISFSSEIKKKVIALKAKS